MRYLSGDEEKKALEYIAEAIKVAKNATCERSKCGSVIVQLAEIIGSGFNSPPQDIEEQRKCFYSKDSYHKKVTDKTCCVHAEQRAIIDALKKNPSEPPNRSRAAGLLIKNWIISVDLYRVLAF